MANGRLNILWWMALKSGVNRQYKLDSVGYNKEEEEEEEGRTYIGRV